MTAPERCPTCHWGRLRQCPDKWHIECATQVDEAVREFAEWLQEKTKDADLTPHVEITPTAYAASYLSAIRATKGEG